MDSKRLTLVVLLDLFKAFDSIDQLLLLAKPRTLGISEISLEWFRSYLSECKQYLRIGQEVSSLRSTDHGVLQVSILNSKLFPSFPVKDADVVALQITEDLKIAAWCCYNSP